MSQFHIAQLQPEQVGTLRQLNAVFGAAFQDDATYTGQPPRQEYLADLLASRHFICLAALRGEAVVGGLVAYELKKFEQERSEIYLYDLAVAEAARREGVATALIEALRAVGKARGASTIFVQADTGEEDLPAIALYSKLGTREDVLHFDIEVR